MLSHLIFLGLFYSVLAVIATTLTLSFARAVRDFSSRRVDALSWQATFPDLPARERVCRHEFTGEFKHRTCDQAFDCRQCRQHAALAVKHLPETVAGPLPDRYYHRGHAWAHPEPDGTVAIGLDPIGESLAANPDAIELPAAGAHIQVNGAAWHMRKRGTDLRILSPVDGEVVATGSPAEGWYLKVIPDGGKLDARHLLRGAEVRPWMTREMERLHAVMLPAGQSPTLADGGAPVADIAAAIPGNDWETLCSEIFLQP